MRDEIRRNLDRTGTRDKVASRKRAERPRTKTARKKVKRKGVIDKLSFHRRGRNVYPSPGLKRKRANSEPNGRISESFLLKPSPGRKTLMPFLNIGLPFRQCQPDSSTGIRPMGLIKPRKT